MPVILGIDPSVNNTGASLVSFDHLSRPTVIDYLSIRADLLKGLPKDSLTARREKMFFTFSRLSEYLRSAKSGGYEINGVAYEVAFHRGGASTVALLQSSAACLLVPELNNVPVFEVHTATVKAVQRQAAESFVTTYNRSDRDLKREALKLGGIQWFNVLFGYELQPGEDAVSDATAVAIAGHTQWLATQAVQTPLFGKGSRRKATTGK